MKKAIKDENLSWRSWWDGGDTSGPIATKWNVSGWPTVYILDAKGVIRSKNARGKEIDKTINALLEKWKPLLGISGRPQLDSPNGWSSTLVAQ